MKPLCFSIGSLLLLAPAAFPTTITYYASVTGAGESTSPGIGTSRVTVDTIANTLEVNVSFSGLVSPTTASHIHCCTALPLTGTAPVATAVPTFPGFPLGVTSGTYDRIFDLTNAATYNPAFVTTQGGTVAAAETALLAGLATEHTYLNIHTGASPGGEIEGFLVPAPEPASFALIAAGFLGLGLKRRAACRTALGRLFRA